MNVTTTEHFLKRSGNRAFTKEMTDVVIAFGEELKAPGGAEKYFLSKKRTQELISEKKKEINFLEKCKNKTIIVEGGKLVTGYKG